MSLQNKAIRKAILNNQLDLFLIGRGGYRISGSTDLPLPNDFNLCWRSEIIPYSHLAGSEFARQLGSSLFELLNFEPDINLGLYALSAHLNWYYFFRSQELVRFELDLEGLAEKFKERLYDRKELLIQDNRWAGVGWNSEFGLWEPVVNTAKFIKKAYNGIDFEPNVDSGTTH